MIDFSAINSAALLNFRSLVEEWLPNGKARGREWVIGDLDGNPGDSLSINVDSGIWKDFASGEGGSDPIGLYAAIRRIKQGEAALELAKRFGIRTDEKASTAESASSTPSKAPPARKKAVVWKPLIPVPQEAPPPPRVYVRTEGSARHEYQIDDSWEYRTAEGGLIGYVVRYRTKSGKETPPLTYCEKAGGAKEWRFLSFPKPLPLYNLPRLTQAPSQPVLGVEGEKCARELQRLFDDNGTQITVTCWPGGCNAIANVDWSPLKGRNFCYWPDADLKTYTGRHPKAGQTMDKHEQPGFKAALKIAEKVKNIASKVHLVDPPEGKPDGWDVYDAIHEDKMTVQQILDLIKARKIDPPNIDTDNNDPLAGAPFRCLGYHEDYHYYLPEGTGQVKAIKGESHNASALLTLAPLTFWWSRFACKKGPDWIRAANAVLRASEKMRVYDPSKRRGRGAWWDQGKIVVHFGESLLVDGKPKGLTDIKTRFIYEAGLRIEDTLAKPLPDHAATKLGEIIKLLWWDRPAHSIYASGWCVLASICGAMDWRPHMWVTGPSGTGKSWFLSNVIRPCIGPWGVFVAADTSAPGIRQTLRSDALPVLFDESEGEDERGRQRMHGVFELMRQSSNESGAKIRKGTQSQKAMDFDIRSMFCLSSIGVNITQRADLSRIIVVSLHKPRHLTREQREQHFTKLCNMVQEILTPDWCASLRARTISLIPVIRENSRRFSQAISEHLGDRRLGDQAGALAAGSYSLYSSAVIDLDSARQWAQEAGWEDLTEADQTDERVCLETILQYVIKDGGREVSVEECLVELANRSPSLSGMEALTDDQQRYVAALKRIGIRLDPDERDSSQYRLWISDSHTGLKKVLEKTPWPQTWGRLLKRLPEAETKPVLRFFSTSTRATGIPWKVVIGDDGGKTP